MSSESLPNAAEFSRMIRSGSGQTSIGGPSQSGRPNQPETVSDPGGPALTGPERAPFPHPRAGSRPLRSGAWHLCHPGRPADWAPPPDRDGLGARLQRPGPRWARLPPHRRASPFCARIEAGLGKAVREAQSQAAAAPVAGADPAPRWTLRRLDAHVRERFGRSLCRETIRAALHRLKLSWKKARKLLGRADPERRRAFVERLAGLLADAQRDRHVLVYLDEAHIHQDADLGYGLGGGGARFWVASHSPRLADKLSFYGLYLYNEGEVRLWPYARANGEYTIDVLQRL